MDAPLEGCFQSICSCCFCHLLCQLPCRPGLPKCICCSEQIHSCGKYAHKAEEVVDHSGEAGAQPMFEFLLFEGFTPAYCCCIGCSCKQECLSCCKIGLQCCSCRFLCEEAMPECGPDGLCQCLLTCQCCYGQCSLPPRKENNPVLACCGKRWRHPGHLTGSGANAGMSSPKQQSMS